MARIRPCGWPHAESQVWALEGEKKAFLKVLRQGRKFAQELYAYHAWLPQLEPVPKLIAVNEARQALLVSAVRGAMLEHAHLSETQLLDVYTQAGAFLRALHELPLLDDEPASLPQAYRQRAESWAARSVGIVDGETRAWVLQHVDEAADIFVTLQARRVPCHHDYAGRNWLIARAGERLTLSVIDFEHARPDFWLGDLEKLYLDGWDEGLEGAFWKGYGKRPADEELELLDKLAAFASLRTIVWAREHHDDPFEVKGRRRLAELKTRLG